MLFLLWRYLHKIGMCVIWNTGLPGIKEWRNFNFFFFSEPKYSQRTLSSVCFFFPERPLLSVNSHQTEMYAGCFHTDKTFFKYIILHFIVILSSLCVDFWQRRRSDYYQNMFLLSFKNMALHFRVPYIHLNIIHTVTCVTIDPGWSVISFFSNWGWMITRFWCHGARKYLLIMNSGQLIAVETHRKTF